MARWIDEKKEGEKRHSHGEHDSVPCKARGARPIACVPPHLVEPFPFSFRRESLPSWLSMTLLPDPCPRPREVSSRAQSRGTPSARVGEQSPERRSIPACSAPPTTSSPRPFQTRTPPTGRPAAQLQQTQRSMSENPEQRVRLRRGSVRRTQNRLGSPSFWPSHRPFASVAPQNR